MLTTLRTLIHHARFLERSSPLRASLCVTLLGAAGCAPATVGDDENVATHRDAVVYGEPSGPEEDAVVFVVAKASTLTARCSATLVAPNLIVTARHCVSEFQPRSFTCTPEGDLAPGSEGGTMGALIPPEEVKIGVGAEPGFNPKTAALGREIFSVETPSICRSDLAMVVLDRDIPNVPIAPIRLDRGNDVGERVRVVGYGLDENLTSTIGHRRTRSGIRIEQVGRSEFRADGDPRATAHVPDARPDVVHRRQRWSRVRGERRRYRGVVAGRGRL